MGLLSHRPLLDAMQHSIDGTFQKWVREQWKSNRAAIVAITKPARTNKHGKVRPVKASDAWMAMVIEARNATAAGAGGIGNQVTSNTNAMYLMLLNWDGRWKTVGKGYWTQDSIEMGRAFWELDMGPVGIRNKVQRFVGLTYGIPGLILDRWQFVQYWLPDLMKVQGVRDVRKFWDYNSSGRPGDPTSLYGAYGSVEGSEELLSLALYEGMETALEGAIESSSEMRKFLGPHANVGGLHWHSWNAVKNEAVGHTSLDVSLDLLRKVGHNSSAADVENIIRSGTYKTETTNDDGSLQRFTLTKGQASTSTVNASAVKRGPKRQQRGSGSVRPGPKGHGRSGSEARTHSIGGGWDPLLDALQDRIQEAGEEIVPFLERMRLKIATLKQEWEARDDGSGDLDLQSALAFLGAIQRALPREIKGFAGSARRLADFKDLAAMEAELARRLPRIETAIETYLSRSYRKSVRDLLKKGAAKVSNSRKATGKIGAVGHAIFKQAKLAMQTTLTEDEQRRGVTLTAKAEEEAQTLLDEIENGEALSMDQVDELDGRAAAIQLFADFRNADSARLREGYELLSDVYNTGREGWLKVLGTRKEQREERIALFEALATGGRAERARGKRTSEGMLKRLDEGIMGFVLSGSATFRRLRETTTDPHLVKLVGEMEDAFAYAENEEADLNNGDNEMFQAALYEIFGVNTQFALARKLKKHSTKGEEDVAVTSIEGRKKESFKVGKLDAERIVHGEQSGFHQGGSWVEVDLGIKHALEEAWDRFEELTEEDQSSKRTLSIEVTRATGSRKSLGPRTAFELLDLYLTMRQADQGEKLDRMGYDETTMRELEAHIPTEVKEFGQWMVNYIDLDAPVIDNLHRQEKGVGLNLVGANYFPVRNDVSGADLAGMSLEGGGQTMGGRSVSFIMARVTNTAEPAIVDALAVFLGHRAQTNFWKSHVRLQVRCVLAVVAFAVTSRAEGGDVVRGVGAVLGEEDDVVDFEEVRAVGPLEGGRVVAQLAGAIGSLLRIGHHIGVPDE